MPCGNRSQTEAMHRVRSLQMNVTQALGAACTATPVSVGCRQLVPAKARCSEKAPRLLGSPHVRRRRRRHLRRIRHPGQPPQQHQRRVARRLPARRPDLLCWRRGMIRFELAGQGMQLRYSAEQLQTFLLGNRHVCVPSEWSARAPSEANIASQQ